MMEKLSDLTKRISFRDYPKYTPEQVEAARRKAYAANCICSPDCPNCQGIGYVKDETGKVHPCANVDLFDLYSKRSGIEHDERALDWDQIKQMNGIIAAEKAVKNALQRGYGWVYIWGPPGVGKTLILKIAVSLMLRSKKLSAYVRMAEILDDLRSAFDAKSPSEESQNRLDWWANLPLLAIDEFDRVRSTEYSTERRFLLMDRRYEQALREKSITLMASNVNPNVLDEYLSDRIHDGRFSVVHLEGKSVRPGMG